MLSLPWEGSFEWVAKDELPVTGERVGTMDLGDVHRLTSLVKPEGWKTQHQGEETIKWGTNLRKGCS